MQRTSELSLISSFSLLAYFFARLQSCKPRVTDCFSQVCITVKLNRLRHDTPSEGGRGFLCVNDTGCILCGAMVGLSWAEETVGGAAPSLPGSHAGWRHSVVMQYKGIIVVFI